MSKEKKCPYLKINACSILDDEQDCTYDHELCPIRKLKDENEELKSFNKQYLNQIFKYNDAIMKKNNEIGQLKMKLEYAEFSKSVRSTQKVNRIGEWIEENKIIYQNEKKRNEP